MDDNINIHFDILEELPGKGKIIQCENNEGFFIFKFDHVLSDGLGVISTICCLAYNYDVTIFPPIMRKLKFQWYHQILDLLFFTVYGFKVVSSILFSSK